jgi:hypothetical protein
MAVTLANSNRARQPAFRRKLTQLMEQLESLSRLRTGRADAPDVLPGRSTATLRR